MRVALFVVALIAAPLGPIMAQDAPVEGRATWTPEEWRVAAEGDVLAAYRIYVESHPGIYDLANPDFPAELARARSAGLEAAAEARDANGYARALGRFNAVLSDGHALAHPLGAAKAGEGERLWPGFAAVWRGDRLLAAFPDSSARLHGAEIVACDGKPIREFLEGALLTRAFRPREEGQWWSRSPQVFYASSDFAADMPRRCAFAPAAGGTQDVALEWREPSQAEREFFSTAVQGEEHSIGLTEPRPGLFHVGMPTFHPDEQGRAAYRALFDQVAARRDELKAARAIVIDLRRNGGGSSEWSHRLAALLWGEEPLAARASEDVSILWRTSAGNSAYVGEAAKEMIAQGRTEIGEGWAKLAVAMEAARARGEPLFDESRLDGEAADPLDKDGPVGVSDFTTPVYVITHGGCASACLDAIDYFKRFDNTRLIGAPTSADSTYMDVRRETLPSGAGAVVIPNKVWVGRERGWGEIYRPDIVMDQLDWSTAAFLDRIEQDIRSPSEES